MKETILGITVDSNELDYHLVNIANNVDYHFTKELIHDLVSEFGENAVRSVFVGILNKEYLPPIRVYDVDGKKRLVIDCVIQ